MDTTKTITHISLCAGYGGIDLGLKRAVPNLCTIAFSEIEAYAAANLVAKMEAGLLDTAPIWTNLKTFPWDGFCGKVDILSGGFPCQPFSMAGKRAGDEDERHLFPYILEGIRRCRPAIVFLENVEGIISAKLAGDGWRDPAGTPVLLHVIRELERVGYKATAGVFSASECGAPHQRKRIFIMAYNNSQRESQYCLSKSVSSESTPVRNCGNNRRSGSSILANANVAGSGEDWKSTKSWAESFIKPSSNCGGLQSREICQGPSWPSRPGEPQHGWEPPRVVGNAERILLSATGGHGTLASASGIPEEQGSKLAQADSDAGFARSGEASGMAHSHGSGGEEPRDINANLFAEPSGGYGEELGNAESGKDNGREPRDLGDTPEQRLEGGEQPSTSWTATNTTAAASRRRETQSSLGGNTTRSSGGMDYAELCISCDNRTDELRLLGNGVVPATAERAFRTLMEKLLNE